MKNSQKILQLTAETQPNIAMKWYETSTFFSLISLHQLH